MSLPVALLVLASLLCFAIVARVTDPHRHAARNKKPSDSEELPKESIDESSILPAKSVQRMLVSGAPPVPWHLRREDRHAMEQFAEYFARSIPTPTSDGRVTVRDTLGYGGPQLALYVPVLSGKSPVAVLARSWDVETEDLEANLFFFGAVNPRLAAIAERLGFERHEGFDGPDRTVFRNRRRFARQRAG